MRFRQPLLRPYAIVRTALLFTFLSNASFGRAQVQIAGWDFQTTTNGGTPTAAAPSTPNSYTANFGTGTLYLNGNSGSSSWATDELSAFGGTALNAGTGFSNTTTSPAALALLGGGAVPTATTTNGKYAVFAFSMTGRSNLVVSYASQKTATGYSTQLWEYATSPSGPWTTAQSVTTVPTGSFAVITLTTITGLNNAPSALLRLSGSGATTNSGNNRLDNIQLNASCGAGLYQNGTSCATCTALSNCTSVTCTTSSNSVCSSCSPGYYLSGGVCVACTAVDGCTGQVTCTSASNSQCSSCASGRYLLDGTADTCPACTAVPFCTGAITCSSASNSVCSSCAPGYYLNGSGVCVACTAVVGCTGQVTCTSASNSNCTTCASGYWRSGSLPTVCTPCTPVAHCLSSLTCTSAANSICTQCEAGYYLSAGGQCLLCPAIDGCTGLVTCTSATTSQCTQCNTGRYLQNGVADNCPLCTSVSSCTGQVSCTSATDSQCSECASGTWLDTSLSPNICRPCTAVPFCTGSITCTNATNSVCSSCVSPGYFLNGGGSCTACTPITNSTGPISCTSSINSQTAACGSGYFLDETQPADRCLACTPITNSAAPLTCTSATTSQTTSCGSGYYLDETQPADRCLACTPITNSVGPITCTSATDSRTAQCGAGFYRLVGGAGTPDQCAPCSAVPHCTGSVTCTTASNSVCSSCEPGYYLNGAGQCVQCTAIDGCTGLVTCTSATTSQCGQCNTGRYLQEGVNDSCPLCSSVSSCTGLVSCTSATDSQCSECAPGTWLDTSVSPNICRPCTAIPFCTGSITCTNATNSVCSSCVSPGYFLNGGGSCTACTPITNSVGPIACTSAINSQTTTCGSGYFLDENQSADRCLACTPIANSTAALTCTSATTSQTTSCGSGYYLDETQPADRCLACTPIMNSTGPITCTSNSDSRTVSCAIGYYRVAGAPGTPDQCVPCTAIAGCTGQVTCTTAFDSQCTQCTTGRYLQNGIADSCPLCSSVNFCTGEVTCTSASDSQCSACASGTWLDTSVSPNICRPCTTIPNCTSAITCTNATNSVCTSCQSGYFLNNGVCTVCPPGRYCPDGVNMLPCPANTFSDVQGATLCTPCQAGYTSPMGATTCTQVPICTENVTMELRTDALSSQASWQILAQNTNDVICQFTVPMDEITTPMTENCCLVAGCYRLRVSDSGGDGFVGGGYQLRESGAVGRRIIDNLGNFSSGSGSALSATYDNGAFCVPLGNDRPIFSSCDKLDWVASQFIVATENTAVSGQYGVGNQTDDGYEFWFFDPNGSYSFRRFRNHATGDGTGTAALRACHFRINGWSNTVATPHLPSNVLLNVRVRGRVNGANQAFGPACLFKIDPARAACPLVKLQDNPTNTADFSCGVSRVFGGVNSNANKVVADPPRFVGVTPAVLSTSVRYQFRFRLPGEFPNPGSCIVRPVQTSPTLYLNWTTGDRLKCNTQYQVDVRVSKDGGATWCTADGETTCSANATIWGKVCNVNITSSPYCPSSVQGEASSMAIADDTNESDVVLYPNPNRGDELFVRVGNVSIDVPTVQVDIYDMTGKRVAMRTIAVQPIGSNAGGSVNTTVELQGRLSGGLYMVHILAGDKTYSERLVIQP